MLIKLAFFAITIAITDEEDYEDAEEDRRSEEEMFEDDQPGPSGTSTSGIGVPGPEDHYSNPPSVSS